ncbi:hypothetical protein [Bermanella sp. R86510]|uniref:hypothetical protein n=1 Tax=unclassified Bermanella TaxID=2627862 RepID=UPI0037CBA915
MDARNKDDLRDFLIEVFGSKAQKWTMTDRMFELTFERLRDSGSCSDLMDLVPRPYAIGKQPIKWLSKEIRGQVIRQLKDRKKHYATCLAAVSWHSAHKFSMASQGI